MEWISVEDRLPDGIGFFFCIVVKENSVVLEGMFNTKTKRFQNRDFSEFNHNITHWMPLPEPPK